MNKLIEQSTKRNLRTEQPHLWQRVLALATAFVVMGVPLLFSPSARTPNANVSIMQDLLPLHLHAFIFIGLGLLLFFGSFYYRGNYSITRIALSFAFGYTVMWLLSLTYGALLVPASTAIVGLWGLMTFSIYSTLKDPGFAISDLIREVRKHHDV